MPADSPARDRVYAFFRRRRDSGLVAEFHDRLRDRVREAAGRDPEPTAGIIDAQSVKGAAPDPGGAGAVAKAWKPYQVSTVYGTGSAAASAFVGLFVLPLFTACAPFPRWEGGHSK